MMQRCNVEIVRELSTKSKDCVLPDFSDLEAEIRIHLPKKEAVRLEIGL